jgi:hypothetical protein
MSTINSEQESMDILRLIESKLRRQQQQQLSLRNSSASVLLPVDIGHAFAMLYVALGTIAIVLNGFILVVLLKKHRYVFKHVFYLLIFNFSLIDMCKGGCAILWAIKTLKPANGSLLILKIDQIALFLLRFCNLATILNLLMITSNEFFFIVYPLRYRSMITKRRTIALMIASWVISLTFTIVILVLGSSQKTVYINTNCNANRNESSLLLGEFKNLLNCKLN